MSQFIYSVMGFATGTWHNFFLLQLKDSNDISYVSQITNQKKLFSFKKHRALSIMDGAHIVLSKNTFYLKLKRQISTK